MKTVKFSFITLALFLFTFSGYSQINFGARVGLNIANQTQKGGVFEIDSKSILGPQIGLLVNVGITDDFSIQPELNFVQRGSKVELDLGTLGIVETSSRFNYIEIPVLVKYGFGTDALGGFVLAGPSFSYALSASTKEGDADSVEVDWDVAEISRGDVGIQFGAGVSLGKLFVDARYMLGVSNLNTGEDDNYKIKNNGINIGLGYMF